MTHTVKHVLTFQSKIKKRWVKPFLECLDITKTKNGDWDLDTELTFYGWEFSHS